MKKILIFKCDKIAYDSTLVFADALGNELRRLGASVDFFDTASNTAVELEGLIGSRYDAVIDFNSKLPGLIEDGSGKPFLDCINARFFNYIVDHPAYHHNNLRVKLRNYNVISIDRNHCDYIRNHYPHIKNILFEPLGGISYGYKDKKKFPSTIIFPSTYLPASEYKKVIETLPDSLAKSSFGTAHILCSYSDVTFEHAVKANVEKYMKEVNNEDMFPEIMQMHCMADIYARAVQRERVLKSVCDTGVNVVLCGEGYKDSIYKDYDNVRIIGQMRYDESIRYMSEFGFVLNVMPGFKSGIHDRIVNTMLNGSVSITDSSEYMDKFINKSDYINYSMDSLESLQQLISEKIMNGDYNYWDGRRKSSKNAVKEITFANIALDLLNTCSEYAQ